MSDTNLQIKNNYNQNHVRFLKFLYLQRKTMLREIKYVKNEIKENKKSIYIGFQHININWYFKTMKNSLKENMKTIQVIRSKLVIC